MKYQLLLASLTTLALGNIRKREKSIKVEVEEDFGKRNLESGSGDFNEVKNIYDFILRGYQKQGKFSNDEHLMNLYTTTDVDDYYYYSVFDDYMKDTVVSYLLFERPEKYAFRDILPFSLTMMAMTEDDKPDNVLVWVAIANSHRCLGAFEYKYRVIEMYYGHKALKCSDVKHPPEFLPGYTKIDNSAVQSYGIEWALNLYIFEPDRYAFMRSYMPKFEVISWSSSYNEEGYPTYYVDMKIMSADESKCLGAFSCVFDTAAWEITWGDQIYCP